MDKKSAIAMVNGHLGHKLLNQRNTSFANINASKDVWWIDINPRKFYSDLHILLVKESGSGLIWLRIKGNSISSLEKVFKVRQDKGVIDLEISSRPQDYMRDVKSGGTGYDFTGHIEHEWGEAEDKTPADGVIHIEVEQETDGRWIAEAPEIPGVLVYASTAGEAIAKAQALALRVIAERIEHGESVERRGSQWFQVV